MLTLRRLIQNRRNRHQQRRDDYLRQLVMRLRLEGWA